VLTGCSTRTVLPIIPLFLVCLVAGFLGLGCSTRALSDIAGSLSEKFTPCFSLDFFDATKIDSRAGGFQLADYNRHRRNSAVGHISPMAFEATMLA
jgi:hypothetical protein